MAKSSVEKIKILGDWDFEIWVNYVHVLLELLALVRNVLLVSQSNKCPINLIVLVKKHRWDHNLLNSELFRYPTCPVAARPTGCCPLHHLKRIGIVWILLLDHGAQSPLLLWLPVTRILIRIGGSFAYVPFKILVGNFWNMETIWDIFLSHGLVSILLVRGPIHVFFALYIVFHYFAQLLNKRTFLRLVDNGCETLNSHCF